MLIFVLFLIDLPYTFLAAVAVTGAIFFGARRQFGAKTLITQNNPTFDIIIAEFRFA